MELRGAVAVVTGASRGIGVDIARALAGVGARLLLVARSGRDLDRVAGALRLSGAEAIAFAADLLAPGAAAAVAEAAEARLGPVSLLVNNAALEQTRTYHLVPPGDIEAAVRLNLTLPMLLTRLLLPGMLERRRGHVVNVSSLAGKVAPAFHESYSATKAGLIAVTHSLRASYRGSGVGFSVVVPGFVRDSGMHQRARDEVGVRTPALAGTRAPGEVAEAVVRAAREDLPEVVLTSGPARVLEALLYPFPRLRAAVVRAVGTTDLYRTIADARERSGSDEPLRPGDPNRRADAHG